MSYSKLIVLCYFTRNFVYHIIVSFHCVRKSLTALTGETFINCLHAVKGSNYTNVVPPVRFLVLISLVNDYLFKLENMSVVFSSTPQSSRGSMCSRYRVQFPWKWRVWLLVLDWHHSMRWESWFLLRRGQSGTMVSDSILCRSDTKCHWWTFVGRFNLNNYIVTDSWILNEISAVIIALNIVSVLCRRC